MLRNKETMVSIDPLVSFIAYVISPSIEQTSPLISAEPGWQNVQRLFKLRKIIVRHSGPYKRPDLNRQPTRIGRSIGMSVGNPEIPDESARQR